MTGFAVTTIKLLEDGEIALPSKENLPILAKAYVLDLDDLARAAYGLLFEEVPEGPDDTPSLQEDGAPADSADAWPTHGQRSRRAFVPTS